MRAKEEMAAEELASAAAASNAAAAAVTATSRADVLHAARCPAAKMQNGQQQQQLQQQMMVCNTHSSLTIKKPCASGLHLSAPAHTALPPGHAATTSTTPNSASPSSGSNSSQSLPLGDASTLILGSPSDSFVASSHSSSLSSHHLSAGASLISQHCATQQQHQLLLDSSGLLMQTANALPQDLLSGSHVGQGLAQLALTTMQQLHAHQTLQAACQQQQFGNLSAGTAALQTSATSHTIDTNTMQLPLLPPCSAAHVSCPPGMQVGLMAGMPHSSSPAEIGQLQLQQSQQRLQLVEEHHSDTLMHQLRHLGLYDAAAVSAAATSPPPVPPVSASALHSSLLLAGVGQADPTPASLLPSYCSAASYSALWGGNASTGGVANIWSDSGQLLEALPKLVHRQSRDAVMPL